MIEQRVSNDTKFWKYKEDVNGYSHLAFVDKTATRSLIGKFLGQPLSKSWMKLKVHYSKDWEDPGWSTEESKIIRAQREGQPRGDFVWLVGAESAAVFNDKALQVLRLLMGDSVEILPLQCEDDSVHLVNVIDMIDCLDQEKSTIKRYSNGSIMKIIRHVFKEELLQNKHIFKLPQPQVPIYVSDTFKKTVEEHELRGLIWEPLP